ncbi:hypothetical protein SAMN05421852_103121 [Thermoflavimicrobium dichotomicum]|uniref:Uncharacterized protein n=1 Tax=Thermoflavimicrobium dichotomicum TaxID=46223 RepID=A0A1I3MLQ2_9BACL|nr:hypothetical protein SAMN05421852_103121 [Thermoflavimicrobium dichotomicum]
MKKNTYDKAEFPFLVARLLSKIKEDEREKET